MDAVEGHVTTRIRRCHVHVAPGKLIKCFMRDKIYYNGASKNKRSDWHCDE